MQRHYFANKGLLVKAVVFPMVMYGCDSWTVNKAECRKRDAFELWYWRRLLRVPQISRRSKQSIPKELSPGCPLEGLMLKLKLQYFGHLIRSVIKIRVYLCKLEIFLNRVVSKANISADRIYRTHLDIDVCTDICQWHMKYKICIYLSALFVSNP